VTWDGNLNVFAHPGSWHLCLSTVDFHICKIQDCEMRFKCLKRTSQSDGRQLKAAFLYHYRWAGHGPVWGGAPTVSADWIALVFVSRGPGCKRCINIPTSSYVVGDTVDYD
jgi:hypothetical protein